MIYETYEIRNWREGHIPPKFISTSIASFTLVMWRGYKPCKYAVNKVFEKFATFGVERVVLRGGISANKDYIPTRYGGKCDFKLGGVTEEMLHNKNIMLAFYNYCVWLNELTVIFPFIYAIELFNEFYWLGKEVQLFDFCLSLPQFNCPLFISEPTNVFTNKVFTHIKNLPTKNIFYPAYQLHNSWSNKLPDHVPDIFAIGEDYCYNDVNEQAFYHSHA
jgi:hypothetical protein